MSVLTLEEAAKKSEELKHDLRKEHFSFGSDTVKLQTTNMELATVLEKDTDKHDKEKQMRKLIKAEMRGHHFSYGKAKPIYASMSSQ
jgi:hypothetical protein